MASLMPRLTKGKDRGPAVAVRLADCTTEHLEAILANKSNLSADYRRVILSLLEDRASVAVGAIN